MSHYDLFFLTFGMFVFEVQHVNLSQIISKENGFIKKK